MSDQPKTPGAMVLVERDLLFRLQERLDCHRDARDWNLICNAIYKPAEQTPAVGGEPDCRVDFENVMVAQGYAASRFEIESDRVEVDGLHGYKWHGQSYYLWCAARRPLRAEIERSTARELLQLAEIEHLTTRIAELVGAVRSINRGKAHEVMMDGDDEPCYAQRKEWVEWMLGLCDEVSAALVKP